MKLKLYFTFIVTLLMSLNCVSQNLVPNPSFESYWECPTNNGYFGVDNWHRVSNSTGTSDYFNVCASLNFFSIPGNIYGNQIPYEGNAYCGSILYDEPFPESREYIQVQLITPLVGNQNYNVSFYVSLGEQCKFATSNIGALLTNNSVTGNGTINNIPLTPQVVSNQIIENSSGWTEISGVYHAIGGEKFLTIGNFNNDALTQLSNVSSTGFGRAYYYFDNVSVTTTNLGIDENHSKIKVEIYPNPSNRYLNLDFQNSIEITEIKIISSIGQVIYKTENSFKTIDISSFSNGLYYLVIKSENLEIVKKIIKM